MAVDHNNPQSRDEEILIATIDGTEYNKLPQSRIEELLLELKEVIEAGSGGGGIKPIGVTTTPLYDGATTNPIQINGESYTAETGDMVTYQSTEFLFNVNEVWQELGDVSEVLEIIDDIFADIAPAFDATSTYAVGDYVIYNDLLYRCTTAHTGAWAAADFIATNLSDEIKNNKGTVYTAGKYINIDANNEIKVNPVVPNEAFTYTIKQIDDYSLEIIKTVNDAVVFDEVYSCYDPVAQQQRDVDETFDDAINIHIFPAGERSYTLLIASDDHEAGFKQTTPWWQRNTFVENFSTVDHSGEKLITKSELDSAIGAIKDGQSIDSFADVETALTSKQNATDNNLQTTDKTVVGAVNELKNGLTNVDVALSAPTNSGKNLLNTIVDTQEINGVTFTVNRDASGNLVSIVANGTASAETRLGLNYSDITKLEKGVTYVLSGNMETQTGVTLYLGDSQARLGIDNPVDTGSGVTFTPTKTGYASPNIYITNGVTVNNKTFYPMIRRADITDPTYAPYIPSVESRIEAVESATAKTATVYENIVINANDLVYVGNIGNIADNNLYSVIANNSNCIAYTVYATQAVQLYVRNFASQSVTVNVKVVKM